MDVSIIVIGWDVKDLANDCLESVYSETSGVEFEVIFVDNGSSDGTGELIRQNFPQAKLIVNEQNQGFVRANNQAIELAEGRYILLLNADTLVLGNAIAETINFSDEHPEAAVVACRVLNPDRSLQKNCFRFYSTLNMLFDAFFLSSKFPNSRLFGRKLYADWRFDSIREVDVVVGCFSLVRKEAIDQVGMMDPTYFVYGDDIDWCFRFKRKGWKVLFAPVGEIIHYGGQATRNAAHKHALQYYGSRLIFVKKYHSYATFVICRLLTGWYLGMRVLCSLWRALVRKKERSNEWTSAKTFLAGIYYCLFDWKGLLMNREVVEDIL